MGLKSPLRKKVRAILETSVPVYGNKRLHVSLVADDGSTTRKITYRRWISRKGVWWRHLREVGGWTGVFFKKIDHEKAWVYFNSPPDLFQIKTVKRKFHFQIKGNIQEQLSARSLL